MKLLLRLILPFLACSISNRVFPQDTLKTKSDTLAFFGQLSTWGHYNFRNSPHAQVGVRYIPSLNYRIKFSNNRQIDFECAANIVGSLTSSPFDTLVSDGSIKPYRLWGRYSTNQLEVRVGLQKINFGPATMLRPLMWFDQLDPRDPLKLTNGVWGALGRYCFLNNANIWLWCLYGNNKTRPWDIGKTNKNTPEVGGRFQLPVPSGEMGLSYHFRVVDTREFGSTTPAISEIPENRIGIDGRFDTKVGLWFEGVWINKSKNIGSLTNQEIFNVGTDYTFSVGNGLNAVFEQLFYSSDENPFEFNNSISFSGLSLNYPIGIVDNISAIVYYDWKNSNAYNFFNWKHKFRNIDLFLIGYLNPEKYNLPQEGNTNNTFAGTGFQIMLSYNY